jgi:hypothetical protein
VAAYYFPNYHPNPRNDAWYGEAWTEWELVRLARPRFPGHRQPVLPAWGYFDESDPAWAAREIALASGHGITAFLYDWYWYDGEPYLHEALEQGFLAAPNQRELKFALMWANHDWLHIQPARSGRPPELLSNGGVTPAEFDRLTDYVLERYLLRPNYLALDGLPYFSVYETRTFIAGLGGIAAARAALARFQEKARAAGLPGLHLNGIVWGPRPGATMDAAAALGLSSVTSYTWIHHYDGRDAGFPQGSYAKAAQDYVAWLAQAGELSLPYFPNATMGWDSSPRTSPADTYEPRGYPWLPVLAGNTPAAFREALVGLRDWLERAASRPQPFVGQQLVTVNAWNEWTEGSYLLPDSGHGTAYLEALRDVFG